MTLSALLAIAMVVPAILQLWAERATDESSALLGFAVSGDSGGADTIVQINEIDPSGDSGTVRVFLRVNFSPTSDQTDQAAQTIPGSAPDFGASVVLGGRLASAIESCDDERFVVTRDVSYDDLLPEEKRAAVEFYSSEEASREGDDTQSQDALSAASLGEYSVIRPDLWFRYTDGWTLSSDNGDKRELAGFFNYTTCSFGEEAFWSRQGVRETFTFPSIAAVSGRLDTENSVLESRWRMLLIPTAYESLVRSDVTSSRLESGGQEFTHSGESWADPRAVVRLRSSSLVFEDRSAKQERDVWIFVAGIGVSILGGLFAGFLTWAVRRRPEPAAEVETDQPDEEAEEDVAVSPPPAVT